MVTLGNEGNGKAYGGPKTKTIDDRGFGGKKDQGGWIGGGYCAMIALTYLTRKKRRNDGGRKGNRIAQKKWIVEGRRLLNVTCCYRKILEPGVVYN